MSKQSILILGVIIAAIGAVNLLLFRGRYGTVLNIAFCAIVLIGAVIAGYGIFKILHS